MKTIRTIAMALCAILVLGTFATAQWGRDRGSNDRRGGGRSLAPRILSDLLEARDILLSMQEDNSIRSDQIDTKTELNAAIRMLQEAMANAGMDPNRLPPPVATNERQTSLVRVRILIEDAHRLLTSGQEPNGDLRARFRDVEGEVAQAREHMQNALSIKQNGQFRGGNDEDRRYEGGDRRRY